MFERMYPQDTHQAEEEVEIEDLFGEARDDDEEDYEDADLNDPDFVSAYIARANSRLAALDASLPNAIHDGEWV